MGSGRSQDLCQASPTFPQVGESTQLIPELVEVAEANFQNSELSQEKAAPMTPMGAPTLWMGWGPSKDLSWAAPTLPQVGASAQLK